jgi:hypothetical protein
MVSALTVTIDNEVGGSRTKALGVHPRREGLQQTSMALGEPRFDTVLQTGVVTPLR